MKRLMITLASVVIAGGGLIPDARSQQKLAQTGFQFMSVGIDARATGMGEAYTTIEGSSSAMFYNPAGMAGMGTLIDVSAYQLKWIAGIIYRAGTAAFAPYEGKYGVIGFSVLNVDYGKFKFTRVAQNEQGYEDITGWPKPGAYVVGLGYGRELSDRFSIGGEVKYSYQNLGKSLVPVYTQVKDTSGTRTDTSLAVRDYSLSVLAFDFGTIYKTGLKSLAFGMSVSNFSREIKYERESFQLPLTFKIGISMNLMDLVPSAMEENAFFLSVDAVHPRSYGEYLNIGGEYVFMNTVALRAGYITNHPDYGLTAGLGVRKLGLAVDYSYMPQKVFDDVHRFSVRFSL